MIMEKTDRRTIINKIGVVILIIFSFLVWRYILPLSIAKSYHEFYLFEGTLKVESVDFYLTKSKITSNGVEYYFQSADMENKKRLKKGDIIHKLKCENMFEVRNSSTSFIVKTLDAPSAFSKKKFKCE